MKSRFSQSQSWSSNYNMLEITLISYIHSMDLIFVWHFSYTDFALNFMLSCKNAWVFIESRRGGARNLALRQRVHHVVYPVPSRDAGQAKYHVANILLAPCPSWYSGTLWAPLLSRYPILTSSPKAASRDPTIPLNEAIALFVTALPTVLFPLFLFAPAWF